MQLTKAESITERIFYGPKNCVHSLYIWNPATDLYVMLKNIALYNSIEILKLKNDYACVVLSGLVVVRRTAKPGIDGSNSTDDKFFNNKKQNPCVLIFVSVAA